MNLHLCVPCGAMIGILRMAHHRNYLCYSYACASFLPKLCLPLGPLTIYIDSSRWHLRCRLLFTTSIYQSLPYRLFETCTLMENQKLTVIGQSCRNIQYRVHIFVYYIQIIIVCILIGQYECNHIYSWVQVEFVTSVNVVQISLVSSGMVIQCSEAGGSV